MQLATVTAPIDALQEAWIKVVVYGSFAIMWNANGSNRLITIYRLNPTVGWSLLVITKQPKLSTEHVEH